MTYEPLFDWTVIGGGSLLDRGLELPAWRHLIETTQSYPTGKYMPPMKAPKGAEKSRPIGALVWEYDSPEVLTARITAVQIACTTEAGRLEFGDDDEQNAAAFAELLLLPACRGAMLAAWGAADGGFHTFLRQLARPLVRLGFTLEPVATGTRCKAIILRKGRRSIWLNDAQEMIGGGGVQLAGFVGEYAPRSSNGTTTPARLAEALTSFQRQLVSMFGVAIHATIGAAALRAAETYMPRQAYMWRTPPLLVSMMREGHGFRGGYSYAERYDGPAYRLDMNKAYTAALATSLPLKSALVPAGAKFEGMPGVYLSRVHGPGVLPAYLAPWDPPEQGFIPKYWNGVSCLAIVNSSERLGLEALGFRVEQLAGYAYVREWTLEPFARRIAELCAQHGRGSAHERTAKIIGNSVYGKFAESPAREQVMYAMERPGDEWHPMLDLRGDELPDLWTMHVIKHRPAQHVELAAHVTGRVRGWLYEAMGTVVALGGAVVHADTDGMLATVDASPYLAADESRPGSWRADLEPRRAIVWGRKGYAYGDEIKAAGVSGLTVDDASRIASGEAVEATYRATPAPWKSSAGVAKGHRVVRATG